MLKMSLISLHQKIHRILSMKYLKRCLHKTWICITSNLLCKKNLQKINILTSRESLLSLPVVLPSKKKNSINIFWECSSIFISASRSIHLKLKPCSWEPLLINSEFLVLLKTLTNRTTIQIVQWRFLWLLDMFKK